jgi:RHH-type transcriptional regulator, rel operon repressor / antitoxin RelB
MTKTMISARVDSELNQSLERLAASARRSKAFLITEALEDYVNRQAWLKERLEAAVKAADESDEYVDHEDMMTWLKSWGKLDELPPPVPKKRSSA